MQGGLAKGLGAEALLTTVQRRPNSIAAATETLNSSGHISVFKCECPS